MFLYQSTIEVPFITLTKHIEDSDNAVIGNSWNPKVIIAVSEILIEAFTYTRYLVENDYVGNKFSHNYSAISLVIHSDLIAYIS